MIIESSSEKTFKIARKRPEIQPFKVESQKLRNFRAHPVQGGKLKIADKNNPYHAICEGI